MLAPKPSDIHALNTPRQPRKPPARPGQEWHVDTASDHIRTVMHVPTRLANTPESGATDSDAAQDSAGAEPRAGMHWMLVGLYWLLVLCVILALYKWSRA